MECHTGQTSPQRARGRRQQPLGCLLLSLPLDRVAPVSGPHSASEADRADCDRGDWGNAHPASRLCLGPADGGPGGFRAVAVDKPPLGALCQQPQRRLPCLWLGITARDRLHGAAEQASGPPAGQRSEGERISAGPIQESQGQRAKNQGRSMQAPEKRETIQGRDRMGERHEAQPMHPESSEPGGPGTGIRPRVGPVAKQPAPTRAICRSQSCADRRGSASRSRAAGRPASARKANRGTCADWQSERIKGESDLTWHRAAISADKLLF